MVVWTREELTKTIEAVQAKAAINRQFRQQALTDPQSAIQSIAGKAVPKGVTLCVIEADPAAVMTIMIPPFQPDILSDQDLDQVTGGYELMCPGQVCPSLDKLLIGE